MNLIKKKGELLISKAIFKIYSDASSFNNGYKNPDLPQAVAIGIVLTFNEKIIKKYSELFPDQNISFGELKAGIVAIKMVYDKILKLKTKIHKPYNIEIYSDSQFFIKGASEWIYNWEKSNWCNYSGKEVAYKELWWQLLNQYIRDKDLNLNFIHVKGHTKNQDFNSQMNELCDKLAKEEIKKWRLMKKL